MITREGSSVTEAVRALVDQEQDETVARMNLWFRQVFHDGDVRTTLIIAVSGFVIIILLLVCVYKANQV